MAGKAAAKETGGSASKKAGKPASGERAATGSAGAAAPAWKPPRTDEQIKKDTGKTWAQWFRLIDDFDGLAQGRRNTVQFIYDQHNIKDVWWCATIAVEYEHAKGVLERDGLRKGYSICATKTLAADADAVFAAWADVTLLNRWFTNGAKQAFEVGGRYENGDGDRGVFKKIKPGKEIVFTWEQPKHTAGSFVEVKIAPKDKGKCQVMVNHNRIQTRDEADDLREAWGGALEKLKELLEKA